MHLVCTCQLLEAHTLILGITTVVQVQAVGLQIKFPLIEWHTHPPHATKQFAKSWGKQGSHHLLRCGTCNMYSTSWLCSCLQEVCKEVGSDLLAPCLLLAFLPPACLLSLSSTVHVWR